MQSFLKSCKPPPKTSSTTIRKTFRIIPAFKETFLVYNNQFMSMEQKSFFYNFSITKCLSCVENLLTNKFLQLLPKIVNIHPSIPIKRRFLLKIVKI